MSGNDHPNSPWLDGTKDAELIRLWADPRNTVNRIAAAMKLTRNQIAGRAKRLAARGLLEPRGSPIRPRAPVTMETPPVAPVERPKAPPKPRLPPRVESTAGHYSAPRDVTCRMILNDDLRHPDYCPNERLPGKAWCSVDFQRVYHAAPKVKA